MALTNDLGRPAARPTAHVSQTARPISRDPIPEATRGPSVVRGVEPARPTPARAGAALVAYVGGVFLAAALAAPWLYRGVRALAGPLPLLTPLTAHPLHRYLQRLLLAFALAFMPSLLRALGLRRWATLGFPPPLRHGRAIALGVGVGIATIAAAAVLPLAAGARIFDPALTPARLLGRVATALVVAPVVALLEEFLFRGVVGGGLQRAGAPRAALVAGGSFYAAVHFLGRATTPPVVTWSSGLEVLREMLGGLGNLDALTPPFFALWLIGAYLSLLYRRTGNLWTSVGVHAGGILVLQLYGLVTTGVAGADGELWGSGLLVDGWSALAVLLAAGPIWHVVYAREGARDGEIAPASG